LTNIIINNLFNLSGKVALVTGGAGYLGKEISRGLAEAGALVVVASRNKDHCMRFAAELGKSGVAMRIDITDDDSVAECMEKIKLQYGRLDILINNAAEIKGKPFFELSPEDFNGTINGTLTSVFRVIRRAVPLMQNLNLGSSIINIASMYGMVSPDQRNYENNPKAENPPDYGAAKAGVIQITKYCACKLADLNIRVNAISPGPFPNLEKNQGEFVNLLAAKTPLKRIGKPWEIKGAVVFLASSASSYITGHNLAVDGGWTAW
jgi:NAD(P)-dependent dehydrogenase (short-subunit alcohol dehydrogenase family)